MLKKVESFVSLVAFFLLFWHICTTLYCFISMTFNFAVFRVLAWQLAIVVVLHIIIGSIYMFTTSVYISKGKIRALNTSIKQMGSGVVMLVSGVLHTLQFMYLVNCFSTGSKYPFLFFISFMVINVLFFGSIIFHCTISVNRALVNLRMIRSKKAVKAWFWGTCISLTILVILSIVVFYLDLVNFIQ